ncbi:hypothetical protein DFJ77DRAFT_198615 [Powellomyces hirtus]|nr:hypothetical protein DFJ77DRAFT_198615 [Powellomyces hirtus]
MEDRTSFILSMVLFVGAVVLGILNGTYVLRQDMFQHRGQRGYMTLYSQTVILVSYVSSLVGGYAYEKGDLYTYYASWHLSAPTLMLGSFLLILALHAFLPAVQLCMSYDVRWNTAAKGLTYAVFVFTTVGVLTTTIIIGYRQVQLRQTTGLEHLLSLRNIFFTMWAAYAPLLCATISILVIRMVIAVKQNLNLSFRLSPDQPENDTAALHAHALLQTIQRRAVVSTCLAIPVTLVVGCASLYPYSAILDGVMTICE